MTREITYDYFLMGPVSVSQDFTGVESVKFDQTRNEVCIFFFMYYHYNGEWWLFSSDDSHLRWVSDHVLIYI